jgi:hypothetical protein
MITPTRALYSARYVKLENEHREQITVYGREVHTTMNQKRTKAINGISIFLDLSK